MRLRLLIYYSLFLIAGALIIILRPAGGREVSSAPPGSEAEQRTAAFFDSIRDNPSRLVEFVRQMPKGGDLHNHFTGAIYAETYINLAARYNLCWYAESTSIKACGSPGEQQIRAILANDTPPPIASPKGTTPGTAKKIDKIGLYRAIIDALSMRNWQLSGRSAHDQFFDSFGKFSAAADYPDQMLAEVMRRAAAEHLSYLELMLTLDNG